MELVDLYDRFKGKTLFFCTYNPYKKGKSFNRFQKIGPVADLIRKRSSNFLVVRERNLDGTAHYHAIVESPVSGEGNLSTLHKDMVSHVDRVGGRRECCINIPERGPHCIPEPSGAELIEITVRDRVTQELGLHHHLLEQTILLLTNLRLFQLKKARTHKAKQHRLHVNDNLGRVLNYINKDMSAPVLFEDYIFYPVARVCHKHNQGVA